jgi:hypothetical protein
MRAPSEPVGFVVLSSSGSSNLNTDLPGLTVPDSVKSIDNFVCNGVPLSAVASDEHGHDA